MQKKNIVIISIITFLLVLAMALAPYISFWFYAQRVHHSFKDVSLRKFYVRVFWHPKDASARAQLAYWQQQAGDLASAEKNYLKVLNESPQDNPILVNLVSLYKQQKNYEKAEQYVSSYINNNPSQPQGYNLLLDLYYFYDASKKNLVPETAAKAYQNTKDSQFLTVEAGYFEKAGDFKQAINYLQQWLDLPENANRQDRVIIEAWQKDLVQKARQ